MKVKQYQPDKEVAATDITMNRDEAIKLIAGLATALEVLQSDHWETYYCGYFSVNEFHTIRFIMEKEDK